MSFFNTGGAAGALAAMQAAARPDDGDAADLPARVTAHDAVLDAHGAVLADHGDRLARLEDAAGDTDASTGSDATESATESGG